MDIVSIIIIIALGGLILMLGSALIVKIANFINGATKKAFVITFKLLLTVAYCMMIFLGFVLIVNALAFADIDICVNLLEKAPFLAFNL